MQVRHDTQWTLVSALVALAIGILVEQAAVADDNRWLERIALLLVVYGIVMIWMHIRPAVLIWQAHAVRAIQIWRSGFRYKK